MLRALLALTVALLSLSSLNSGVNAQVVESDNFASAGFSFGQGGGGLGGWTSLTGPGNGTLKMGGFVTNEATLPTGSVAVSADHFSTGDVFVPKEGGSASISANFSGGGFTFAGQIAGTKGFSGFQGVVGNHNSQSNLAAFSSGNGSASITGGLTTFGSGSFVPLQVQQILNCCKP